MDKFQKDLCKREKEISEQQFLTEIFLLIKGEYIAKTHCNGENITVELLNGQTFKLTATEL